MKFTYSYSGGLYNAKVFSAGVLHRHVQPSKYIQRLLVCTPGGSSCRHGRLGLSASFLSFPFLRQRLCADTAQPFCPGFVSRPPLTYRLRRSLLQKSERLCPASFRRDAPAFLKCRLFFWRRPGGTRKDCGIVYGPSWDTLLKSFFRRLLHRRRVIVVSKDVAAVDLAGFGIDFVCRTESLRRAKIPENLPAVSQKENRSSGSEKQKTSYQKKYCYGFHFFSRPFSVFP